MTRSAGFTPRIDAGQRVEVVGLGGVGGIVARYASVLLGAIGRDVHLILVDGDTFEPANAERMSFAAYGNKAEVTAAELMLSAAADALEIEAVGAYVGTGNVAEIVRSGDIVLLCVDNHATRKLVSDHAGTLDRICLISGGNDGAGPDASGTVRRGTYGNCQVYVRANGADVTPSLTRFHPEIATPRDRPPTDPSCTDAITKTPQVLCANLTVAACMINALWLHLCDALSYAEVAFDVADALMRPLPMPIGHGVGAAAPAARSAAP